MTEAGDKTSADLLLQKVDTLQKKMEEYESATRQGKTITRLVLLLIAIAAIGSLWRTYSAIRSIPPKKYEQEALKQMEMITPMLADQAQQLVKNVYPTYEKCFKEEFEKHMPELASMCEKEMNSFITNVKKSLNDSLTSSLHRVVVSNLQRVAKDQAGSKSVEHMNHVMERLQDIYYSVGQETATEALSEPMGALADLQATLETFQTPPHLTAMSDEALASHTQDILLEFIGTRLNLMSELDFPGPNAVPPRPPSAKDQAPKEPVKEQPKEVKKA